MRLNSESELARRSFLQGVSGALPTLSLVSEAVAEAAPAAETSAAFTPVELGRFFNASATDFGPRSPI